MGLNDSDFGICLIRSFAHSFLFFPRFIEDGRSYICKRLRRSELPLKTRFKLEGSSLGVKVE